MHPFGFFFHSGFLGEVLFKFDLPEVLILLSDFSKLHSFPPFLQSKRRLKVALLLSKDLQCVVQIIHSINFPIFQQHMSYFSVQHAIPAASQLSKLEYFPAFVTVKKEGKSCNFDL